MARAFTTLAAAVLSASLAGCVTASAPSPSTLRPPVVFAVAPAPFDAQGTAMLDAGAIEVQYLPEADVMTVAQPELDRTSFLTASSTPRTPTRHGSGRRWSAMKPPIAPAGASGTSPMRVGTPGR